MTSEVTIPRKRIQRASYLVRGEAIMLDADLAPLHSVSTGNLNQAVQRNLDRFPPDSMFQLTAAEAENLRFQIGISSSYGGRRHLPHASTRPPLPQARPVLPTGWPRQAERPRTSEPMTLNNASTIIDL